MPTFIIILLFLCSVIFFIYGYKKQKETDDYNNKIKEEKEKLLKDKESIINEINFLNNKKEETNKDLKEIETITRNINAAAHEAFTQYSESLDQEYTNTEQEYDAATANLKLSYDRLQDIYLLKIKNVQNDLDKITATRAAAMEAQLKEQEIKDKLSFYCPQVSADELKDAKILRDIEYKLNNPRVLRMLI